MSVLLKEAIKKQCCDAVRNVMNNYLESDCKDAARACLEYLKAMPLESEAQQ